MSNSTCTICGKEFARKNGLDKHKEKKVPCKAPSQLIQVAVREILEQTGSLHLEVPTTEFRETSKKFNSSITKDDRLEQGIFFTPKKVRDILFAKLAELGVRPKKILEPSFGSGEFLLDAKRLYPTANIVGVEKNEDLFKAVSCADATLTCGDFLQWSNTSDHDLIIGNPPYFILKETKQLKKKNAAALTGRPNIYILFLYKCLSEHLAKDGFLAFIIPTSLYNCSYYQPMRNYIQANTTILHVETLNKPGFYETTQETMLIILQKKKINDNYIFKSKSGNIYISPFYKELYKATENTTTLKDLGLGAKTGNVVWNQVKENLADDGTLLIYSSNIGDDGLMLNNLKGEKKQYVKGLDKPTLNGPLILIERGYGNSLRFNSVLIKDDMKNFYAENHVNVIYPKTDAAARNLADVMTSFKDERTMQFMKWFIGNGSVSATDLETIVPIFTK